MAAITIPPGQPSMRKSLRSSSPPTTKSQSSTFQSGSLVTRKKISFVNIYLASLMIKLNTGCTSLAMKSTRMHFIRDSKKVQIIKEKQGMSIVQTPPKALTKNHNNKANFPWQLPCPLFFWFWEVRYGLRTTWPVEASRRILKMKIQRNSLTNMKMLREF